MIEKKRSYFHTILQQHIAIMLLKTTSVYCDANPQKYISSMLPNEGNPPWGKLVVQLSIKLCAYKFSYKVLVSFVDNHDKCYKYTSK